MRQPQNHSGTNNRSGVAQREGVRLAAQTVTMGGRTLRVHPHLHPLHPLHPAPRTRLHPHFGGEGSETLTRIEQNRAYLRECAQRRVNSCLCEKTLTARFCAILGKKEKRPM